MEWVRMTWLLLKIVGKLSLLLPLKILSNSNFLIGKVKPVNTFWVFVHNFVSTFTFLVTVLAFWSISHTNWCSLTKWCYPCYILKFINRTNLKSIGFGLEKFVKIKTKGVLNLTNEVRLFHKPICPYIFTINKFLFNSFFHIPFTPPKDYSSKNNRYKNIYYRNLFVKLIKAHPLFYIFECHQSTSLNCSNN